MRVGECTMIWIANALVALVALLHVYFLVLEMFLWTKPLGLKTFRQTPEKARDSAVLAANQGLYNGFLAAGLVWGLIQGNPAFALQIKTFFLVCVIVAGIYGAATVSRRILTVQAAPAALALISLWLA
jgi:putative membrane protein